MDPQKEPREDLSMRRRRLRYRAWHRGTRELDLMLGPFVDAYADEMGGAELDRLERLLVEAETDLQNWFLGQAEPPPSADRELIDRIIAFRQASN